MGTELNARYAIELDGNHKKGNGVVELCTIPTPEDETNGIHVVNKRVDSPNDAARQTS
jgi:hypothetical protein